jgi:transposase
MGRGRRSWTLCALDATRPKGRIGRSARTRPSLAPTSTRPEPGTLRPSTCPQGAVSNDNNCGAGDAGRGREALGRSRGGLTTKIHMVADRRCRPIARLLTGGQRGDAPRFIAVMDTIKIGRRGPGRPRTRPGRAMGDKAYSSKAIRSYLRKRGIKTVIPVKEDQKKHRLARGRAGGRPPVFDTEHYKQRNTVERCFSKLKQFRAVATRYDERARIYQGTVDVASIIIWLRDPVP